MVNLFNINNRKIKLNDHKLIVNFMLKKKNCKYDLRSLLERFFNSIDNVYQKKDQKKEVEKNSYFMYLWFFMTYTIEKTMICHLSTATTLSQTDLSEQNSANKSKILNCSTEISSKINEINNLNSQLRNLTNSDERLSVLKLMAASFDKILTQSKEILNDHIKNIFISTIFDNGLKKDSIQKKYLLMLSENPTFPDPPIFFSIYFLFLETFTSQNILFLKYKNVIRKCKKNYHILKMINQNHPLQQKLLKEDLKNKILKKIKNLKEGENYPLPGGWLNSEKIPGHFIFYLFEKKDNALFRVNINTHSSTKEKMLQRKKIDPISNLDKIIDNTLDLLIKRFYEERVEKSTSFDLALIDNDDHSYFDSFYNKNNFKPQTISLSCCFLSCLMLLSYMDVDINKKKFRNDFRNYLKELI